MQLMRRPPHQSSFGKGASLLPAAQLTLSRHALTIISATRCAVKHAHAIRALSVALLLWDCSIGVLGVGF